MPATNKKRNPNLRLYAVTAIVLVIAAAIVSVLYLLQPPSFAAFKNAFTSAGQVAIFTQYNGTYLGSAGIATVGCATQIMQRLHGVSINFFQINKTSCVYARIPSNTSNYTTAGIGKCLNLSKGMPAIFINYSIANVTTVTPSALYVSGNLMFLRQCGIAPLLSH